LRKFPQLKPLTVLYEDNHLLAVFKPARVLTVGDETGDESLLDQAKSYLKQKYNKPGDVFLGVVHRLDRPVSGVVLFARTSKAAGRLSEQFRSGSVRKVYHAWVEGTLVQVEGELNDWLLKNENTNVVRVVPPNTPGSRHSVLRYRALETEKNRTLVEVSLITGRSHQIRVQLAHAGHPIEGDRKYGARTGMEGAIALSAVELEVEHPVRRERIVLRGK